MDPDPHLLIIDPDPDPGGPKTYGSSGSATLCIVKSFFSGSAAVDAPLQEMLDYILRYRTVWLVNR
jgi:hypothetical protein